MPELDVTDTLAIRRVLADIAELPDHKHLPREQCISCIEEREAHVHYDDPEDCPDCRRYLDAHGLLHTYAEAIARRFVNGPLGLIDRATAWVDQAGVGDGGQRPFLEITYSDDGKPVWLVELASFYDGSATQGGDTLAAALHNALDALEQSPYMEKQRRFEALVAELAKETGLPPEQITDALHQATNAFAQDVGRST